MPTLEGVKRQISSAEDLQAIVKTMKSLAAVSIRHYERAATALAAYHRTIALGLQAVLRDAPPGRIPLPPTTDSRLGMIVFGSDQGLCGRFNDQSAQAALDGLNTLAPALSQRLVLAVGERAAARLQEMAQAIETTHTMPASLAGVTPMVYDLLLHIEAWRAQGGVQRIVLVHNRLLSGSAYQSQVVPLVPIDLSQFRPPTTPPWPSPAIPLYGMARQQLQASLLRQHLFVTLYRAVVESLASEYASRLASMQGAENNIAERLEDLQALFRYQRQNAITAELLDIVAGFEAVRLEED
jgi:F-type H+-transporting ATPase subunit gamma